MSETDVKGTMLGYDGHGQMVYVGSFVEHLEKQGFGIGRVTTGGLFYKDEVACKVDFEHKEDWTARLSKIKVVPEPKPVKKPVLADFGYKVGDKVHQVKYNLDLTITSDEIGTYRDEPCCYTNGGRPTRFSQIVKTAPEKSDFDKLLDMFEAPSAPKCPILKITLPNGKIVTIEVE